MLDELEWPSLETRREQSSLTFFYKIHSGTVSLDKYEYLTPAPNLRRTICLSLERAKAEGDFFFFPVKDIADLDYFGNMQK